MTPHPWVCLSACRTRHSIAKSMERLAVAAMTIFTESAQRLLVEDPARMAGEEGRNDEQS
jgi:hypothetical protein